MYDCGRGLQLTTRELEGTVTARAIRGVTLEGWMEEGVLRSGGGEEASETRAEEKVVGRIQDGDEVR